MEDTGEDATGRVLRWCDASGLATVSLCCKSFRKVADGIGREEVRRWRPEMDVPGAGGWIGSAQALSGGQRLLVSGGFGGEACAGLPDNDLEDAMGCRRDTEVMCGPPLAFETCGKSKRSNRLVNDMCEQRADHTLLADPCGRGYAYAIGGRVGGQDLASMEVLDIVTGCWSEGMGLREPRCGLGGASVPGALLVCGGLQRQGRRFSLQSTELYIPEHDVWRDGATMNSARDYPACAVLNDRVYAIGGDEHFIIDSNMSTIEAYDTVVDRWSVVGAVPQGVIRSSAATAHSGRIFVLGGMAVGNSGLAFAFDPREQVVHTLQPVPNVLVGAAAVSFGGQLLCIGGGGGQHQAEPLDTVHVYCDRTCTWRLEATLVMCAPRWCCGACVL